MSEQLSTKPKKLCFVTIGATASFHSLISASLEPGFLRVLAASNYTDLLVQYGAEGESLFNEKKTANDSVTKELGISIAGFAFKPDGLSNEVRATKSGEDRADGVVISHAG